MQAPLLTTRHALFLDFDGTLVDLASKPDLIRPDPQIVRRLTDAAAMLQGAMALLTGRRLESVDAYLSPLRLAGAGLHGAQQRAVADGEIVDLHPRIELPAGLQAQLASFKGLWLEEKGSAAAIHYRDAPALGDKALDLVRRIAAANGQLEIVSGKLVHEARPRGADKGAALHAFMQAAPFAGRVPVFVGDDATDEDAIRAAQSLGGIGIKVGPGASAAQFNLIDPQAVLIWLRSATQPSSGA